MTIMESLSLKSENIYDPIRKKWVSATPEEQIRQHLIRHMVEILGYPPLWLAIEKELSHFVSNLSQSVRDLAKRRADILVLAPGALSPLLLIECKAVALNQTFIQQVLGYNDLIQAPFVSLANGNEVMTGHFDAEKGRYCFEKGLPAFADL